LAALKEVATIILVVLLLNPVMWFILALIWPRFFGSLLKDYDTPKWLPSTIIFQIFKFINLKIVFYILPWISKKKIALELQEEWLIRSPKKEVKLFKEYPDEVDLDTLSPEAFDMLWDMRTYCDILCTKKLTTSQFEWLVHSRKYVAIERHIAKYTLSDEKAILLLKSQDFNVRDIFLKQVRTKGLSPKLVASLFSKKNSSLQPCVKKALIVFEQTQVVKATKDAQASQVWREFCKSTELCVEAEKELNLHQYKILASEGKKISDNAVFHHLSQVGYSPQHAKLADTIIQNQLVGAQLSDKLEALIAANPTLKKMLLGL